MCPMPSARRARESHAAQLAEALERDPRCLPARSVRGGRAPTPRASRRPLAPGCAIVGWRRGIEEFRGYATFAAPVAALLGVSLAGGLLQVRRRRSGRRGPRRSGAGSAALEGTCATAVRGALARLSANVVACIRPPEWRRRVCLVRPRVHPPGPDVPSRASCDHLPRCCRPGRLGPRVAAGPLLRRLPGGECCTQPPRGTRLRARRCLRSGSCAAKTCRGQRQRLRLRRSSQLAGELAAAPLEHTQVDVLITSCEESGLLGAQAYARGTARVAETISSTSTPSEGDVPLTYILREGTAFRACVAG